MKLRSLEGPAPIEAVLFDFHATLVDQGDPQAWLELAWRHAGRAGTARDSLGAAGADRLAAWVNRIWEHVLEVDPHGERDLSPRRHREVYDALVVRVPELDAALSAALYEVMLETWVPYDDALPVLRALRARGLKLALISNVGLDVRSVLGRAGMGELFDAVILSFEVGAVKPHPPIFQRALDVLGVPAARALMVGDNAHDDAGAARLGIRTLLLPRTRGLEHGLDLVLRLVGP
jgi:HAD superfamily hydrolase (TIGR01509 family)